MCHSHNFTVVHIEVYLLSENIVDADGERWVADTNLITPGVLLGILCGGVAPGSPSLTRFHTKKCNFPHPFSDQTFNPYPFSDLAFRQKLSYGYLD